MRDAETAFSRSRLRSRNGGPALSRQRQCLAFLGTILIASAVASACPLCKDSAPTGTTAAFDVNGGILTMLAGVACVAGWVGWSILKVARR